MKCKVDIRVISNIKDRKKWFMSHKSAYSTRRLFIMKLLQVVLVLVFVAIVVSRRFTFETNFNNDVDLILIQGCKSSTYKTELTECASSGEISDSQ